MVVEAWVGGVVEAGVRAEAVNRAGRWWCGEVGGDAVGRLCGGWSGARLRGIESCRGL